MSDLRGRARKRWATLAPELPGTRRALTRRALKRRAPMGRYTCTLNVKTHMDLARGAHSSAHVLVSACLVPSDTPNFPTKIIPTKIC